MNKIKIVTIAAVFAPALILSAASNPETVVTPNFDDEDQGAQYNNTASFQSNSYLDSLIRPETPIIEPTATETQIQITTEIGTATIQVATSAPVKAPEIERLSEVVERINQDYEVAEQQCQIGSWLERIWCSVTAWF